MHAAWGPAALEHCMLEAGFEAGVRVGHGFDPAVDYERLLAAVVKAGNFDAQVAQDPVGVILLKTTPRGPAKPRALTSAAAAAAVATAPTSEQGEVTTYALGS